MRYVVGVNGREHVVELNEGPGGTLAATLDGAPHALDAVCLPGGRVNVVVDGRVHDVDVDPHCCSQAEGDGVVRLRSRGSEVVVTVVDEQRKRLREAANRAVAHDGPAQVRCPMPGKLVKVLKPVGAHVQAGEGLVVVEAMKMENEIRAPNAGTVLEVHCTEGQPVDGGAVLVVLG